MKGRKEIKKEKNWRQGKKGLKIGKEHCGWSFEINLLNSNPIV